MNLTDKARRALVSLSDGEWVVLGEQHPTTVISNLVRAGYIRDDMSFGPIRETAYTITPDGLAALEAS